MKKKNKSLRFNFSHKVQFRYNPDLDKYENQVLFPEKLEQANKMLKNAKFPDNFFSDKSKKPL